MDFFSKIPEFYENRKVHYVPLASIRRSVPPSKTFVPKLQADILKNGMLHPLTLKDHESMICYTGNQRLAVLKSLNVELVPVIFYFPWPSQIQKAIGTHTDIPLSVPRKRKKNKRIKKKECYCKHSKIN